MFHLLQSLTKITMISGLAKYHRTIQLGKRGEHEEGNRRATRNSAEARDEGGRYRKRTI